MTLSIEITSGIAALRKTQPDIAKPNAGPDGPLERRWIRIAVEGDSYESSERVADEIEQAMMTLGHRHADLSGSDILLKCMAAVGALTAASLIVGGVLIWLA